MLFGRKQARGRDSPSPSRFGSVRAVSRDVVPAPSAPDGPTHGGVGDLHKVMGAARPRRDSNMSMHSLSSSASAMSSLHKSFKSFHVPRNFTLGGRRRSSFMDAGVERIDMLEVMGSAMTAEPAEPTVEAQAKASLEVDVAEDARAAETAAEDAEATEASLPKHEKSDDDRAMLRKALKSTAAFDLDSDRLLEMAVDAFREERPFKPGAFIIREGAPYAKFYVVASGMACMYGSADIGMVEDGEEIVIGTLTRGDAFNMATLVRELKVDENQSRYSILAEAEDEPTVVYSLRRADFSSLLMCELPTFDRLCARRCATTSNLARASLARASLARVARSPRGVPFESISPRPPPFLPDLPPLPHSSLLRHPPSLPSPPPRLPTHRRPIADFLASLPIVRELQPSGWFASCRADASVRTSIDEFCACAAQRRLCSFGALLVLLRDGATFGEPFVIIKSGLLTVTLKSRHTNSDSDVTARKMFFGRGDAIGTDMLKAIRIGVLQGAVDVAVSTAYLTIVGPERALPDSALRRNLHRLLEVQYLRKLLATMDAFAALKDGDLDAIVTRAHRRSFEPGTPILKAGTTGGGSMFVVVQGSAKAEHEGTKGVQFLGRFGVGEQFGAQALIEPPGEGKLRTVTVTAESDLLCLELNAEVFGPLLERVTTLLARDVANRRWQLENWGKVSLPDLGEGSVLGEGTYGLVCRGLHRTTGRTFAVKSVQKAKVASDLIVRQILNERALMAACNHPYVCKLAGAYQSVGELYFILELVEGGELFDLLEEFDGSFDFDMSRFYLSNVLAAVSYMHRLHVAHRDIKMENLLVDSDGYLKLIDLGFAKHLGPSGRTISFCGTPQYMAPEIMRFESHEKPVDLWALGCLTYEMLFGSVPFAADDDPLPTIYQTVVQYVEGDASLLHFPLFYGLRSSKHWDVVDLVSRMLAPQPEHRPTALEATEHRALEGYPVLQIERKAFAAPYVPDPPSARAPTGGGFVLDDDGADDDTQVVAAPSDMQRFPGFDKAKPWGRERRQAKQGDSAAAQPPSASADAPTEGNGHDATNGTKSKPAPRVAQPAPDKGKKRESVSATNSSMKKRPAPTPLPASRGPG